MNNRSLVSIAVLSVTATVSLCATLMAGQQRQSATPAATSQPARGGAQAAPAAARPAAPAAAASATTKAAPYVVKKTADGQPDLQGYWTNATYTPLERGQNVTKEFFTEEEYAASTKQRETSEQEQTVPGTDADVHYDFTQFALDTSQSPVAKNLRTSLIIDPPNGRLPARVTAAAGAAGRGAVGAAAGGAAAPTAGVRGAAGASAGGTAAPAGGARGAVAPAAGARGAAAGGRGGNTQYDQIQNMANGTRCIIMGGAGPPMLDAGYNSVYQIIQSPGYVTIVTEMIHDVRIIPLDSRPLPPEQLKQWVGLSRGRWEGNTLIVETANFNGRNPIRGASANARVTERFTRLADDRIDYQFTVTDETTWVSPWTASVPLTKEKGPIFEFACHESNYGPANILSGARAVEKAAAATPAGRQ